MKVPLSDKNNKKESLFQKKKEEMAEILMDILDKESGDIGLDAIETSISKILRDVRKITTEKMIEKKDVLKLNCSCGMPMKNCQKVFQKIIGLVPYTIQKRLFYCSHCKKYECPLNKSIQVKGRFSLEIKKAMTLLGQRLPFEESSEYLQEILHVNVSHDTIHRFVKKIGKKIAHDEECLTKEMLDEADNIKEWRSQTQKLPGAAYLELDGSMVQTRESGWKEVRIGILFKEKDISQSDRNHKKILKKKYFSIFNSKPESLKQFKNRTTQESYAFRFHDYEKPVILADGAKWIWEYADIHHPYAIQILDYYHANEYLNNAWIGLKLPNTSTNQQTKKQLFDWLWDGNIKSIISYLLDQSSTKEVSDCIRYFRNNQKRMRYKYYRDKGLDIGSGAIESAHRTVIQSRMKQSGMHWKTSNVQSIASIRSKYLSGQWSSIVENYLMAA